jgi:uncharacterized protein (TIGR02466 family)
MPTVDPSSQWLPLFPVPVLQRRLADAATLNPALLSYLTPLRHADAGIQRTNVGGWHSDRVLQHANDAGIQRLLGEIRQGLTTWAESVFALPTPLAPEQWQIFLWANFNGRGHSNRAHDHFHTGVLASGFYYVRTGGTSAGGKTVFLQQSTIPRYVTLGQPLRSEQYAITPEDGSLFLFPSWLGHQVEPYQSDEERVTLAFDAGHPAIPISKHGDRPLPHWLKRLLGR